jgi:hypothetical protein
MWQVAFILRRPVLELGTGTETGHDAIYPRHLGPHHNLHVAKSIWQCRIWLRTVDGTIATHGNLDRHNAPACTGVHRQDEGALAAKDRSQWPNGISPCGGKAGVQCPDQGTRLLHGSGTIRH